MPAGPGWLGLSCNSWRETSSDLGPLPEPQLLTFNGGVSHEGSLRLSAVPSQEQGEVFAGDERR